MLKAENSRYSLGKAVFLILMIIAAGFTNLYAQSGKVDIKLKQPPPNQLGVGDMWNLELTNTTDKEINIYLTGTATEEKDGLIIEGKSKVFTLKPGRSNYKYNDFSSAEVKYNNGKYKEIILRTGNAPEGSYTICVTAFDEGGTEVGRENCIMQSVQQMGGITLLTPGDGEEIDPDTLPGLMFTWTPLPKGGPYSLRIVELKGSESKEEGIRANRPIIDKEKISISSYQLGSTDPKLEAGKKYAWQVKSGDVESEVLMFSVRSANVHIGIDSVIISCDDDSNKVYDYRLKISNLSPTEQALINNLFLSQSGSGPTISIPIPPNPVPNAPAGMLITVDQSLPHTLTTGESIWLTGTINAVSAATNAFEFYVWGVNPLNLAKGDDFIDTLLTNCADCDSCGTGPIWYFGHKAGIDFRNGIVTPLSNSAIEAPLPNFTTEGTAIISDDEGNIRFYTDGVTVWDRNNQVIPNLVLHGAQTSTQSAVILPMPGNCNRYYVFTAHGTDQTGQTQLGLKYTVIDMTLNGGLGEADPSFTNVPLQSNATEKLAAVRRTDGGYWIVAHGFGPDGDKFFTYELTTNGLTPNPTISTIGRSHTGLISNKVGQMKISPNGNRIAVAVYGDSFIEIFDFNMNNGEVSTSTGLFELTEMQPVRLYAYGIEFSPNSQLVYFTTTNNPQTNGLYRINLSSSPNFTIETVFEITLPTKADFLGQLQLAPDGKIYVARNKSNYLGVIHTPDNPVPNFVDLGVQLNDGTNCDWGLPTTVVCPTITSDPCTVSITGSPQTGDTLCKGTPVTITWTSNTTGNVNISLINVNNWNTYQVIASNVPNIGSYNWILPAEIACDSVKKWQFYVENAERTCWNYGPVFYIECCSGCQGTINAPAIVNYTPGQYPVINGVTLSGFSGTGSYNWKLISNPYDPTPCGGANGSAGSEGPFDVLLNQYITSNCTYDFIVWRGDCTTHVPVQFVPQECDCAGDKWNDGTIEYSDFDNSNQRVSKQMLCYTDYGRISVGNPIVINKTFNCNPLNCAAKYDYYLYDVNTGALVLSGTDLSMPITITPTTVGNYRLDILSRCGTYSCSPCNINLIVAGGADCDCKNGMWLENEVTISYRQNGVDLTANNFCNQTFNIDDESAVSFSPNYPCPAENCNAQFKYSVNNSAPSPFVPSPYTITIGMPVSIKVYAYCGDKVCDSCEVNFVPINCCDLDITGNPQQGSILCPGDIIYTTWEGCTPSGLVNFSIFDVQNQTVYSSPITNRDVNIGSFTWTVPYDIPCDDSTRKWQLYLEDINGECWNYGPVFHIKCCDEDPKCKCGEWDPFGTISYLNGREKINDKIFCDKKYGIIPSGQTFQIDYPFHCATDCPVTYDYTLYDNAGNAVQSGSGVSMPFTITPTTSGSHRLEIIPNCGKEKCKPCVIHIEIEGKEKCDCNNDKYTLVEEEKGSIYKMFCDSTKLVEYGTVLKMTPKYFCIPQECFKSFYYEIRDIQTDALVSSGTTVPIDVTLLSYAGYKVIITADCNGTKCQCTFYIRTLPVEKGYIVAPDSVCYKPGLNQTFINEVYFHDFPGSGFYDLTIEPDPTGVPGCINTYSGVFSFGGGPPGLVINIPPGFLITPPCVYKMKVSRGGYTAEKTIRFVNCDQQPRCNCGGWQERTVSYSGPWLDAIKNDTFAIKKKLDFLNKEVECGNPAQVSKGTYKITMPAYSCQPDGCGDATYSWTLSYLGTPIEGMQGNNSYFEYNFQNYGNYTLKYYAYCDGNKPCDSCIVTFSYPNPNPFWGYLTQPGVLSGENDPINISLNKAREKLSETEVGKRIEIWYEMLNSTDWSDKILNDNNNLSQVKNLIEIGRRVTINGEKLSKDDIPIIENSLLLLEKIGVPAPGNLVNDVVKVIKSSEGLAWDEIINKIAEIKGND